MSKHKKDCRVLRGAMRPHFSFLQIARRVHAPPWGHYSNLGFRSVTLAMLPIRPEPRVLRGFNTFQHGRGSRWEYRPTNESEFVIFRCARQLC